MNAQARPRAVLYLRQSIAREESISLELQEDAGRRYAEQQGYSVVAVKADEGISGRSWKTRPAVQEVMKMIEDGQADVIVLWKWSRLSRARLDWAVAVDKVEASGGRIESATESVDVSTSTGRFARGMLAEVAAFESERISDTWKESQSRRISQGKPHGGNPRFGYTYDRATGYTPDPIAGPVLRECYRRYNRGESLSQLLAYIVSTGVPTSTRKDAGDWTTTRISAMLRSPFAAGIVIYNGQEHEGTHEPLITMEEWEEYQVRQSKRKGTRTPRTPRSAFTGLPVCMACNHKMHLNSSRQGSASFQCAGVQTKKLHKGGSITEAKLEEAVLSWFKERIAKQADEAAKKATATTSEPAASDATATVRRALVKEQARLDSLTAKYVDDVIPQASYEKLRDEIQERMEGYEQRLRSLRVDGRKKPIKVDPKLLNLWPRMTVAEKQRVLGTLIDHLQVTTGRNASSVDVVPKWAVVD